MRTRILAGFLFFSASLFAQPGQVTLTILTDNTLDDPAGRTEWGFSCLVDLPRTAVLFDAGMTGETFDHNVQALGADLSRVEYALFSHDHADHTGGVRGEVFKGKGVTVHIGSSFSDATEKMLASTGATVLRNEKPVELLPGVWATGEVAGPVTEQSLVISTDKGLVVITGCSHPGVIDILERAKEVAPGEIYMVLGGFHWLQKGGAEVRAMIDRMKELGVKKCGATHCSGEMAIGMVREAYGDDFVEMGVGRTISLSVTHLYEE